jgi:hypothetical protein
MMRTRDKFILNKDGTVRVETDLLKWAKWMEESRDERVVKQEWVDNVRISTVFLGLNHRHTGEGPPILWETMLFTNRVDFRGRMWRCPGTREHAEAQHAEVAQLVKDEIAKLNL